MIPPVHDPRKPSALSDPQPHTVRATPGKKHCGCDTHGFCSHSLLVFFFCFFFCFGRILTLVLLFSGEVCFFNRVGFFYPTHASLSHFHENWVMITSPTVSFLRNSTNPAWQRGSSGERGAVNISRPFVLNSVSPADPSRQASRLPIKVLKMLTARSGHILHPEYLQPLPSTPVSPIEVRTAVKRFCAPGHLFAALRGWTPELSLDEFYG